MFTDGSVFGEGPGYGACAAVLYTPSCDSYSQSRTRAIGTMVNSLEYEIEGIVLGMELVLEYITDQSPLNLSSTVYILCDCKSAINSVTMLSSSIRPQIIKNLESLH